MIFTALAMWLSWLEHRPITIKVAGLILGQDAYFGYGFTPSPHLSALGGNQLMFLSRPFLLSKSNEKMSSGEHLKKIRGYSHQFPHVIE